jgi:hypothetical protein
MYHFAFCVNLQAFLNGNICPEMRVEHGIVGALLNLIGLIQTVAKVGEIMI